MPTNVERAAQSASSRLIPVLLAIAALAVLVPALLVRYAPVVQQSARTHPVALAPRRVVPPAEVPPVEPMDLVDLTPDDARAFNATVPFVAGPLAAARPFRFAGEPEDRARATDCLAAALIYEAGDDAPGERAVAQVILNRLRHPAYPKTVCAVVFQGSERRTGCQFTFTCDGALTRWTPSETGWARAQALAAAALSGSVDRSVGLATHYHTNWVVPYWQSSLDKIAAVGTHLFFRWTGWWGTPAAFRSPPAQAEPAVAKLAALSTAHRVAAGAEGEALAQEGQAAAAADGPAPVATDPGSFLVTLPANFSPDAYPLLAMDACGERPQCKYSAWSKSADTPRALPLAPEQVATMTFSYLRDRPAGIEKLLWNCQQAPRMSRTQCMKVQVLTPIAAAPPSPQPSPTATRGPADLPGVRRRPGRDPEPAVEPSPVP